MPDHRQSPILTAHDGGGEQDSGEQLLNDVFDLIRRRLPRLACDDPVRVSLTAVMPELARRLDRPHVMPVRADRLAAR